MNIIEKLKREKEIINSMEYVELIREYNLVNNYGYIVKVYDKEVDIRHWLNMYGAEVNYWDSNLKTTDTKIQKIIDKLVKKLDEECR